MTKTTAYAKDPFPHATHDFFKPLAARDPGISDWGPSLTRQEFAEDCDINVIMDRFATTGIPPANMREGGAYLDLTDMPEDLQSTLEMLKNAETAFMTLPATVRREFDNDPVKFVDFASNPANSDKMVEWGLSERPVAPAPTEVIITGDKTKPEASPPKAP